MKEEIIERMNRLILDNQMTTPDASEIVLAELSDEQVVELFAEYGKSILVFIFNSNNTSQRREFRNSKAEVVASAAASNGKPARGRNTNQARVERLKRASDMPYLGADGYQKKLGAFTLADVEFQMQYYSTRIASNQAEMSKFERLHSEFINCEAATVDELFEGREDDLDDIFRNDG